MSGPHANLQILPAGRVPANPSELVGSERMHDLITELAQGHRLIIDAPPLLAVTDAGLLTVSSDSTCHQRRWHLLTPLQRERLNNNLLNRAVNLTLRSPR